MVRLKEKYKNEVIPKMKEIFGYKNDLAVPKIEKVVLNVGAGKGVSNPSFFEEAAANLAKITGQQPVKTFAKKSIAGFKIRKGMPVGLKVTLRGDRMYEFLDKLINVTLARIRDFRGLDPKGFDGKGNYSIGIAEHIAFPEIQFESAEKIHGLQVNITTTAKDDKEGYMLLKLLGFPFKEEKNA